MQLGNHRNKIFPPSITLTEEEAFYLINFALVKMINIFSYNKGNFVATRSHRSWFILFEKIWSYHPN